ncbi:hypothetical protein KFK09_024715 [Dendrobium nobile]|uniref:Uncharacterized protein n=1 Tax=Dendrobium nobile TaxID=94219 RepID=A0A8T3AEU2_DENNO|nr:hypothetical protein KFK09_024715 [Dendrobium nobile]
MQIPPIGTSLAVGAPNFHSAASDIASLLTPVTSSPLHQTAPNGFKRIEKDIMESNDGAIFPLLSSLAREYSKSKAEKEKKIDFFTFSLILLRFTSSSPFSLH